MTWLSGLSACIWTYSSEGLFGSGVILCCGFLSCSITKLMRDKNFVIKGKLRIRSLTPFACRSFSFCFKSGFFILAFIFKIYKSNLENENPKNSHPKSKTLQTHLKRREWAVWRASRPKMVTDQEKFQTQIKFNRFLCEGMFQVLLQERHPVPRHQIVGQPDQRKLPAIQRGLPTDFIRSGNLGY